ncbi:MAG: chloride channel protein [Bacteroidales bacterium]|nr:chloride channel protein [Bacteroidales bacterium]
MEKNTLLTRFLAWRARNIKHKNFVLIVSFFIGIISGLAAVLLKNVVHYTGEFLTHRLHIENVNLLYLILPIIGITLTMLFVRLYVKDNIGHGVTRILYAISRNSSQIKSHNTYTSMIASTLTVGFGGSVGLEAPIVLTGSAIGSNFGKLFRMNYKTTTLLIGCGAAGAIAGIFKAPIAAFIFALEVLMLDLTMSSIVPLLISSVTAATVSYFLLGQKVVFSFTVMDPLAINNLPYYIILGIICGLVSVYFTRGTIFVESFFSKIKKPLTKLLIGGITLSLLIFLLPPLYGEGYDSLKEILGGNAANLTNGSLFYEWRDNQLIFLGFLAALIFLKVIAMAVTTASGGVGGIFAPTLYTGGIIGYFVAKILNNFNIISVSERNFALVGMAGLMAGVMHAPLTSIFLIAEITGGYNLFIPLIVCSTIAYLTIMYFEPHSIYTHRLAKRGELITHHKDKAVLTMMKLDKVVEKDFSTIHPEATLGELVKVISKSKRNVFPVVDKDDLLLGIVMLDNIRDVVFNHELYNTTYVTSLMVIPPAFVSINDPMERVMEKFEKSSAWNLPVVDKGKYIGFVSRSKIFSSYRKLLVEFTDE